MQGRAEQDDIVGKLERENRDDLLLAWLMRYQELKNAGTTEELKKFKKAAYNFHMHFNFRADQTERRLRAYQLREDEDKAGDRMGHSPMTKARELYSLQEPQ